MTVSTSLPASGHAGKGGSPRDSLFRNAGMAGTERSADNTAASAVDLQIEADPRFRAAQEQMQKGDWHKAAIMLRNLIDDFPGSRSLGPMLKEAEFKLELESDWGETVRGRRFPVSPRRMATLSIATLLCLGIVFGGMAVYRNVIVPNQRANEIVQAHQALVAEADAMLQTGRYQEAITLFNQALAEDAENPALLAGLEKATTQLELDKEYNVALSALHEGDTEQAFQLFSAIDEKAPGYRDVSLRLNQLMATDDVEKLFANANLALRFGKWDQAAGMFEDLREIDGEYESQAVASALYDSYLNAGLEAVSVSPDEGGDPVAAQEFFRKALTLRVGDEVARHESDLLRSYLSAQRALAANNLEQTVATLEPVQAERPEYMGGFVSQMLYRAYLDLGDVALRDGDRLEAYGFFGKAAGLNGVDPGEANLRLESLAVLLTPTPTPTMTPTPAPAVPPTATATPPPLDWFKGWIAFKSNREGGVYVMRPDGSEVRPVAATGAYELYDAFYEKEQWSPDGTTRIYAEKAGRAGEGVDLFKFRHDLPENWERRLRVTDAPGDDYDPVWSPNNQLIAYVSNTSGNDEIWTVRTDDTDHKQLTWNDWEWDKHPSWSPDGTQIVFYSNRSGMRQIWMMNADGSDQHQLSNGQYEEWDPIWIK